MGVSWPRCLLIVASFAFSNVLAMTFAQSNIPQKWKESERPLDTQQFVTLDVMLPLSNLDSLEHLLYSVSDPNSLQYGHFLEEHEADAIFRPASGCAAKVISWLESTGATHIRHNSHSVSFATTIDDANRMLNASFRAYEHESGILHIRTMRYEIPDHLADSIDFISPTTYFGEPRSSDKPLLNPISSQESLNTIPRECNSSFTFRGQQLQGIGPECIKALYKVNDYNASLDSGSSLAFGSFLNESASHADLLSYQAMFGIQRQSLIVELINGGKDTQPPEHDHEANLDSQILMGVAHPLPVTEFIVGGSPPFIPDLSESNATSNRNEPFLPYYSHLLSKPNAEIPLVISNSYGENEQTVPIEYAKRVCNMIGILGLRGITVIESSGDTGAGVTCKSNDGKNTTRFNPQFPATCPYLTSVGGTQFGTPSDTQAEIAWIASSGGFSDYFRRPRFQDTAVNDYISHASLQTKKYFGAYCNPQGRGFPDVAAHSFYPGLFEVFVNGILTPSGGTSASAPVFAAVIALLNDARMRVGKHRLGFLNPLLYNAGSAGFNDIFEGFSKGCNGIDPHSGDMIAGAGVIDDVKWNATRGWDPVTGLGTPNFEKLHEIVLSI